MSSESLVDSILRLERDPLGGQPELQTALRAAYAALDEDGAVRLADALYEDDGGSEPWKAAQSIERAALFNDHVPHALIDWMLDRECFDVPIAFRGADAGQTQRLIEAIESELHTDAVRCLCYCPQPAAVATISAMHRAGQTFGLQTPEYDGERWITTVAYTPVIEFALDAGWCFDASGRRRALYLDDCWELEPAAGDDADAVAAYAPTALQCGYCGHAIGCVLPRAIVTQRSGADVPGLYACTGCGEDLQVRGQGPGIAWSSGNGRPDWLDDDCHANYAARAPQRMRFGAQRSPFYAGLWAPAVRQSKFGGFPFWVQSQAYPRCHGCAEPMLFVAQISIGEFDASGEGDEYYFVCPACTQSAVVRQTT